jgi:hypothetical protein
LYEVLHLAVWRGPWTGKLFVLADVAKAPLVIEAVRWIDAIFDFEREISGQSAARRVAVRRNRVCRWLRRWRRG